METCTPDIAVHLHLYYPHMWERIKNRLINMADYPYHLYVTMPPENEYLANEIKAFHFPTTVYIVENCGYDVGPFIYFLNHIKPEEYDFIIKIHTKSDKSGDDTLINKKYLNRKFWSEQLVDALIGSKKIFERNLRAFIKDQTIGMIGSKYCITSQYKNGPLIENKANEVMQKLGSKMRLPITFVAGTMFMVRGKILQKLRGAYKIEDFAVTDGKIKDGTLAHAMERVFGCMVTAEGYKIKGFDYNILFEINNKIKSLKRFIYQKKITNSGFLQIKTFKITVYRKKLCTKED